MSKEHRRNFWRRFSEHEESVGIFQRGYWLDAVAPNGWDVSLLDEQDHPSASLPFAFTTRFGVSIVKPPPLTQFMCHWSKPSTKKLHKALSDESKILEKLYSKIFSRYFLSIFHISEDHYYNLPLQQIGAIETVRYHYKIDNIDLANEAFEFSDGLKYELKRARTNLYVKNDTEIDSIYRIIRQIFEKRNMNCPYSAAVLYNLHHTLVSRGEGAIISALSKDCNTVQGSSLFCWDTKSVYYVCGGGSPEHRGSGASSLLIHQGMMLAKEMNLSFDFLGSQLRGIEAFFRSFGAKPVRYSRVTKCPIPRLVL